ncbi:uncharacterized protein LOC105698572 [Orussus abietinus]|uniref:uncharacterized protein LOC105698572 n=1 Tax=Orussus abietinus TaxID=222816 RepID=UPI000625A8AC|nr:uncharacterized protein LOC105698572 [Orussus abietinus]
MSMLKLLGLLLPIAVTTAAPLSSVHVKFVSPPHTYEHGLTTDGGNTIAQKSFLSIGRRDPAKYSGEFGKRIQERQGVFGHQRVVTPENAESLWPTGLFLPPIDINDLGYSSQDTGKHMTPDFSNGLEHPDPLLLTGEQAMLAVKYIYGRGELFYNDFPHVRALLRNQDERLANGLHGHILSSLRPQSPFYRKIKPEE